MVNTTRISTAAVEVVGEVVELELSLMQVSLSLQTPMKAEKIGNAYKES